MLGNTEIKQSLPSIDFVLQQLRPKKRENVKSLLEEVEIDTSKWEKKKNGDPVKKANSNINWCYEWSFGSVKEKFALSIWYESINIKNGKIIHDENLLDFYRLKREESKNQLLSKSKRKKAGIHARRARDFFDACLDSYRNGLPISMLINVGDRKKALDSDDENSSVRYRCLDSEKWYVHDIDEERGDCLIVRGEKPNDGLTLTANFLVADGSPGADDEKRFTEISVRRGQAEFRDALLNAYQRQCYITDCKIVDLLEAAHITPHAEEVNYKVQNGLLLRADIHTLYDLHLLGIDDNMRVVLSKKIINSEYKQYNNKRLVFPGSFSVAPDPERLAKRFEIFKQKERGG